MSGATERREVDARPMRVLIVRVGAMGDVLHGLPAVAALRRMHPDWEVDWAVEPKWWEMLVSREGASEEDQPEAVEPGPVVDAAIAVKTRLWKELGVSLRTVRAVLGLRRRLRARRYDLCIDLQGSVRSAAIGWMAGAERFVGPDQPREKPARLFYGDRVGATSVHVIDQACELIGGALREWVEPASPVLPVDTVAEAMLEAMERHTLRRADHWVFPDRKARLVVLAPTAGWGAKEWPVERFGELARRLAETGLFVLVNADTSGSSQASAVARAGGNRVGVMACTIAELTSLLRRASLFIGGDTGPMHLADALGVAVVALFGPTDPARTGPRGAKSRVLRDPGSVTDHRRYAQTESGLARITVEEVMAAAMDLLEVTEGCSG